MRTHNLYTYIYIYPHIYICTEFIFIQTEAQKFEKYHNFLIF